jgi:hypothetical protein
VENYAEGEAFSKPKGPLEGRGAVLASGKADTLESIKATIQALKTVENPIMRSV